DKFTIILSVEAQKPEYFEKLGLKVAYVVFDRAVTTPPTDLKPTEDLSLFTKNKDGTIDLAWKLRSVKLGLTAQAHVLLGAPKHKSAGNKAVMAIGFRGLPDDVVGIFILDAKLREP